ncbi:TSC22 domain family protein 4-like isoform 1-T2 [Fundulus diaphanus]
MSAAKRRSGFQITSVTCDLLHLTSPTDQSGDPSTGRPLGSSSQPNTPSLQKKYISQDALGQRAGSRFRVVRLREGGVGGGGRGQPYQRGRWTCTEFRERVEGAGLRCVMDSMRNAHSLDSLDMIGWDRERGGVISQDTSHPSALPLRGMEGAGLVSRSGPPSPTHQEPHGLKEPTRGQRSDSAPSPAPRRPQHFPQPLQPGPPAQRVFRTSQSLPSSPPSGRPTLTPVHPSAFGLEDSLDTSAAAVPAIDSKIEQAMPSPLFLQDLAKTHLMLAVRDEVELLREQIRDLQEKNQQLETENRALKQRHYAAE